MNDPRGTESSHALTASTPERHIIERQQQGQHAVPDLVDRLKTALAGRCAIEHELGAGGMATVYLAEDLKHHRKVAVKVLRPGN